ncbi:hypothetical protein GCM10028786_32200 [Flaviaesturariibacter terrae]
MYADDDVDDREMLQQVFAECSGNPFLAFSTGDDLIEYLQGHVNDVCVVILDINMPPKSGTETLAEIRQDPKFSRLPIVIYTTASSPLAKKSIDALDALTMTKASSHQGMVESARKILAYCESFRPTRL